MKKLAVAIWVCAVLATSSLAQTESEALNLLKSDNWSEALRSILVKRKEMTPAIIAHLESEEEKVQIRAAQALRAISNSDWRIDEEQLEPYRSKAVEALKKVWRNSFDAVKGECLLSLVVILRVRVYGFHGEIRSDPKEAQPLIELGKSATRHLVHLLSREKDDLEFGYGARAVIVRALAGINDPSCASGIIDLIGKSVGFLQAEAMQVLTQFNDPRTAGVLIDHLDAPFLGFDESPAMVALRKLKSRAIPDLLEAVLNHERVTVRALAASYFIRATDARSVPVLQRAILDSDPSVRASAAQALANNPDPSSVPFILPLLSDSTARVREAAARGLGAIGDKSVFDYVSALLTDGDTRVRRAAVFALPGIDKEKAVKTLLPLIHEPVLQESVVFALRPLLPKEAEDHLIAIAGHRVDWVRIEAIEFLAELKSVAAVPVLLDIVHGVNVEAKEAAAFALGAIKGPAANGLLELLPKVKPEENEEALLALALTGDARAFGTFERLLKTKESKLGSIRALGRLGDKRAIPLLLPFLNSSDGDEQRYSITAIGNLKVAAAVPTLIEALKSTKIGVPDRAAVALARIGDPRAVSVIIAMAQDRDNPSQWFFVEALGSFPGPQSIAVLSKILDEGFPNHIYAARALGQVGDLSVIRALESVARNDRSAVAIEAEKAIEAIRKRLGRDGLRWNPMLNRARSSTPSVSTQFQFARNPRSGPL